MVEDIEHQADNKKDLTSYTNQRTFLITMVAHFAVFLFTTFMVYTCVPGASEYKSQLYIHTYTTPQQCTKQCECFSGGIEEWWDQLTTYGLKCKLSMPQDNEIQVLWWDPLLFEATADMFY